MATTVDRSLARRQRIIVAQSTQETVVWMGDSEALEEIGAAFAEQRKRGRGEMSCTVSRAGVGPPTGRIVAAAARQ